MRRLPTELSCSVFELLNFAERISATHVCRRWRKIALGHGQLWSTIRTRDVCTLAALLERTRSVPVDVRVPQISSSNFEEIVTLIGAHLGHIRLLSLHAGEVKLEIEHVPVVHQAFSRAAPLLEVVDIQLFDHPFPGNDEIAINNAALARVPCDVPQESFLHLAPRLRQLSFHNIPLLEAAGAANAFSNVNTLELDVIRLSAPQVLALVSLPSLRSLHLDVAECEMPQVPAPSTFKLDTFWVDGLYSAPWDDPVHPLLLYLGFPNIRHFTTCWQAMLPIMTERPRSPPHTLHVEHWKTVENYIDKEAWRMIDSAGFVTDLLDVHTGDLFSWPEEQSMLANLRELVIMYRELCDMASDYDIEFRNLTRLCVRLDAKDYGRHGTSWPEEEPFPAPQLRTLELWGGMGESMATMRAVGAVGFVRDFLALDRAHPPELILRDVGFAHPALGLAHWLEGLVSGIQCPEGPAPESFVVELKSKWRASVQP